MADAPPLLDLDDVKLNLRVDDTTEDDLIEGLIADAQEFVEGETGLILTPRTVTETVPMLGRWIDLASWPVRGVTAIRYPSASGLTPLVAGSWQFSSNARPVRLLPVAIGWGVISYPQPCIPALPVEIDVDAGYADPTDVPRRATRAMQLLVAHWHANRASAEVGARAAAIEVPFGVTALCQQLKLVRV